MSTLCKDKKSKDKKSKDRKKKRKKRNVKAFESSATHQCQKCKLMACSKKLLCKPKKR